MREWRRPASVGLFAVGVIGLAACSGSSGTSAPSPTVTVTETVTQTASPTAGASTSTPPTSSTSATATAAPAGTGCRATALNVKIVALDSGAGQRYGSIVLTNSSSASCTVKGYPGMQLFAAGKPVPTRVVRVSSPAPTTVTLKPGAQASSAISFGAIPTGSESATGPCETTPTTARVTPPDATASIVTSWTLGAVCNAGRIATKALIAGNGG